MRLVLTLLAAALLAPSAAAQMGASGLSLVLQPPTEVVQPLQGPVTLPFEAVFTCPPTGILPPGAQIQYLVTRQPAWASVVVTPTSDAVNFQECLAAPLGGAIIRRGLVTVSATADAPAFSPDLVELEAWASVPAGESTHARSSAPVIPGFFSVLDVSPGETIKRAASGQAVAFPVRVTNFGNANTRVSFDVESVGAGVRVVAPPDVMLQSKQAGGSQISTDVVVSASRLPGAVGDVLIAVRYTSHYALDPKLAGASGTFTLLLRSGGEAAPEPDVFEAADADPPSSLRELPLSPLAAILAGVGAALLRRRG